MEPYALRVAGRPRFGACPMSMFKKTKAEKMKPDSAEEAKILADDPASFDHGEANKSVDEAEALFNERQGFSKDIAEVAVTVDEPVRALEAMSLAESVAEPEALPPPPVVPAPAPAPEPMSPVDQAAALAGALASARSDGTPVTLAELRQLERDIKALKA